jgi:hypothetical protein
VCNLLNPRIYISDICFSAHHSSWTCVYNNFLQNEIYKILKIYNDNLTRLFALLKRYQITEEIKKSRFPYSPLLFYWPVFIFWSFLKQRRDCSSRVHALLDLSVLWEKRLFSYWNRIRLETTNKQSISSLVIFIAKLSSVQKWLEVMMSKKVFVLYVFQNFCLSNPGADFFASFWPWLVAPFASCYQPCSCCLFLSRIHFRCLKFCSQDYYRLHLTRKYLSLTWS